MFTTSAKILHYIHIQLHYCHSYDHTYCRAFSTAHCPLTTCIVRCIPCTDIAKPGTSCGHLFDLLLEYQYPSQGVFMDVAVCTSSNQFAMGASVNHSIGLPTNADDHFSYIIRYQCYGLSINNLWSYT